MYHRIDTPVGDRDASVRLDVPDLQVRRRALGPEQRTHEVGERLTAVTPQRKEFFGRNSPR
jgi:hypothetical protein